LYGLDVALGRSNFISRQSKRGTICVV